MISHPAWRLAGVVAVAATLFALVALSGLGPSDLRSMIEGLGILGPVVYCLLGALLRVALVPVYVVAGTAGLLFGPTLGFVIALVAATAGALTSFSIARRLGRDALEQLQSPRIAQLRGWIAERGFMAIVLSRLAPIPAGIVDYAGGMTAISPGTFALATAIGLAPRTLTYAAVGGSLDEPDPIWIASLLGLLALVSALALVYARRTRSL